MPKLVLAFAFLVAAVTPVGCSWRKQAQNKREARYQTALQPYSEMLRPGATRKDAEDYLRAEKTSFGQICCIDEPSTFADLVKIGKEHHPWYCEEHNVYIAFQFAAVTPRTGVPPYDASDSDVLKSITIWHHFEGCL